LLIQATEYNELALKGLSVLFLLMIIFLGLDFGIFAAASMQIKDTLELDNL
jgi:hypothetical protein